MSTASKIAIIGAGGKTTLLNMLSAYKRDAHVLATTTTHIRPMSPPDADRLCINPEPDALRAALSCSGITCAGILNAENKLCSLSPELLALAEQDADYIFYEADGAKRMPLKLHNQTEPVILPGTAHCIIVAGLSALGRPLSSCVHRYLLHPEWSTTSDRPVDWEIILTCIRDAVRASNLPPERLTILLNQIDVCPDGYEQILQHLHPLRCAAVSLQRDGFPALLLDLL